MAVQLYPVGLEGPDYSQQIGLLDTKGRKLVGTFSVLRKHPDLRLVLSKGKVASVFNEGDYYYLAFQTDPPEGFFETILIRIGECHFNGDIYYPNNKGCDWANIELAY